LNCFTTYLIKEVLSWQVSQALPCPGVSMTWSEMLGKISHRGRDRAKMLEKRDVTMQAAWHDDQARPMPLSLQMNAVWDGVSAPFPEPDSLSKRSEPFALAAVSADGLFLARDMLGVKPLYYGETGRLAGLRFRSQVPADRDRRCARVPARDLVHARKRVPILWKN
jgi:hypothetical protein